MKERLIELISSYTENVSARDLHKADFDEKFADYLIENGVIALPCKVGDKVYEIYYEKSSGQKTIKKSKVTAIKITDKLIITLDYTTNLCDADIGRWLFVGKNAKEEAEQSLVNYKSSKNDVERKEDVNEKKCEFCERFNFSKARTKVDEDGAIIELALCNTDFPKEEQFNFCPVCGRNLRKEDEGK